MKRTRLLIALLVMLVAASGYAQDSYRQAIKDYLTAIDVMEQSKSVITSMNIIFDNADQLTNRYVEERLEDDVVDYYVDQMTTCGMTEADLKELATLLSSPQGKACRTHLSDFTNQFLANYLAPIQKVYNKTEESEEILDLVTLLENEPIQLNPGIDETYAAKFNEVMMDSPHGPWKGVDDIMQSLETDTAGILYHLDPGIQNWIKKNIRTIMLNSGYETMSLEDLDYASNLFNYESYRKIADREASMNVSANVHYLIKYTNWMEENGAKVSENPENRMDLLKQIFKSMNLNLDDFFLFKKQPFAS